MIGNSLAGLNNKKISFQLACISCCCELNVCVPSPQIHLLKPLISSGMVFEVRPLRGEIRSGGWSPHGGITALLRRDEK